MSLKTVRRLASDILGVGESHIKILDPKRAAEALTRDDVRGLVQEKVVVAEQKKGIGRGKAKIKQARKKLGRRVGPGSAKGSAFAKVTHKSRWIAKIRSQRKVLRNVRKTLKKGAYRKMYMMAKGNQFRGKKQLREFLVEKKLLK